MSEKLYALVDCNSFYCSCEQLFRPDLKNQAVGVLSNNDGCFVGRTPELKALGVPMGAPYFKYKGLCFDKGVAVFSANFPLYSQISDRIMNVLKEFTPFLEVYSIDEAFLDLSELNLPDAKDYAFTVKNAVERKIGIPVSIGIGPSKTLAKLANVTAKKNLSYKGICQISPEDKDILDKFSISDVWGIGKGKATTLIGLGVNTAWDLIRFENDALIQKRLTKTTRVTQEELRGHACMDLQTVDVKKKEIICGRSFGETIGTLGPLKEAVAHFIANAARKLRAQKSRCSVISVSLRTNPFGDSPYHRNSTSYKIPIATADTRKMIAYAWKSLESIYREGEDYKKASISLYELSDQGKEQLDFFSEYDTTDSEILMKIMDEAQIALGDNLLRPAACSSHHPQWRMNQKMKSPSYTIGWDSLPRV